MPDYVVEPPDLILVEVLEALPGRPISGERLVRPDGKISLGFYGEVYVAGLTIPEIKEKIVLHLRKFLTDEVLGLVEIDPRRTGKTDGRQAVTVEPKDSDRVFVDVTAYNSKNYYVQGDVAAPGQDADHGQRDRARRHQLRRRPDPDGRPPEHPPGPPGPAGGLLRAGPARQPGGDHQRRRPDHQLPAHARRPARRLPRPDRPDHDLHRPPGGPFQTVLNSILQYSFTARSIKSIGIPIFGGGEHDRHRHRHGWRDGAAAAARGSLTTPSGSVGRLIPLHRSGPGRAPRGRSEVPAPVVFLAIATNGSYTRTLRHAASAFRRR